MSGTIEQRKVAGVVTEASRIVADKGFNRGEIIIGLSELIGRIIVDVATSTIQAQELRDVVVKHLDTTIDIGSKATGKVH